MDTKEDLIKLSTGEEPTGGDPFQHTVKNCWMCDNPPTTLIRPVHNGLFKEIRIHCPEHTFNCVGHRFMPYDHENPPKLEGMWNKQQR